MMLHVRRLMIDEWCNVREVLGKCLGNVWEVSALCVGRVIGGCLVVFGVCLGCVFWGVWVGVWPVGWNIKNKRLF